jgi:hypothetical protein
VCLATMFSGNCNVIPQDVFLTMRFSHGILVRSVFDHSSLTDYSHFPASLLSSPFLQCFFFSLLRFKMQVLIHRHGLFHAHKLPSTN